eukprot:TRINITY_DN20192_c0_g2_i1.p1 TRINITY_DN20192_c0_g2~~TRINITY_DN20192_c0_g2_i1.p1  ORF type:complete len:213 (+),score=40.00 TRINITY_DN20192_c0_g2_i1:136-774(+)
MADIATGQVPDLKYLGFFRLAVLQTIVYISQFYVWAKNSSGPLKPGVDSVEGMVQTVVEPLYAKWKGKPDELLKFADEKVAVGLAVAERSIPTSVKETETYALLTKVPENSKAIVEQVKEKGLIETAYPIVVQYAAYLWALLLTFPFVVQIIKAVLPSALFAGEQYNKLADYAATNETLKPIGSYLPKVPVEDIKTKVKADTDAAVKGGKIE